MKFLHLLSGPSNLLTRKENVGLSQPGSAVGFFAVLFILTIAFKCFYALVPPWKMATFATFIILRSAVDLTFSPMTNDVNISVDTSQLLAKNAPICTDLDNFRTFFFFFNALSCDVRYEFKRQLCRSKWPTVTGLQ